MTNETIMMFMCCLCMLTMPSCENGSSRVITADSDSSNTTDADSDSDSDSDTDTDADSEGDNAPDWDASEASPLSVPLLLILMDFSDTALTEFQDENGWADIMFGRKQGQGNHYWYEVSGGQFQYLRAKESYGTPDNGVVQVRLNNAEPNGEQEFVVESQSWIPDSLDQAATFVRFSDFDTNGNGIVENNELAILVVLATDGLVVAKAGAEASISINHTLADGTVIDQFARTLYFYTSIGVNVHELAHHVFDLGHVEEPSYHALMGMGCYAEDPVVEALPTMGHWGTRPTHLVGVHKIKAGFIAPTGITESTSGVKLYAAGTDNYNIIELQLSDGSVYLENRRAHGYDASIPFAEGHTGGLFATEVRTGSGGFPFGGSRNTVTPFVVGPVTPESDTDPYAIPPIDHIYSLKGHNDTFTIGRYTISNVSEPGEVMTFDITVTQ